MSSQARRAARPRPCRAVDGAGRSGVAGFGAAGFGEAERFEPLEGAVDELAGEPPDVADRGAGLQLGGDVVAVAGLVDEHAEDGPLVERQRGSAFHASRLPRSPSARAVDC